MLAKINNLINIKEPLPAKCANKKCAAPFCLALDTPCDTFTLNSGANDKISFKKNDIFTKHANRQRAKEIIKDENLPDLKLGAEINRGNEAVVYGVKNNPEWVVRVEHENKPDFSILGTSDFDENPNVIASIEDGKCQVLKRLKGEPLYGKNWEISSKISSIRYLQEMEKLKKVPDEAFVKYCRDIVELRKNSMEIDNINPNNILYDKNKKEFNLVDIKKKVGVREKLYIQDFYPFIDSRRLPAIYKRSGDLTRSLIGKNIREFLDRMIKIAGDEGWEIKVEDINRHRFQNFVTYLYHDDKRILNQYTL